MFHHPLGTHLMYVDGNPLLYGFLQIAAEFGVIWELETVVTVINAASLWSAIPAVWLLFLIGKKFSFPNWYAGTVALLAVLLSPQLHRLTGHYSLSHLWVIPLLWWCLLQWQSKSYSFRLLLPYLASAILVSFLHPYFGLISAAFLGAFSIAAWLKDPSFRIQPILHRLIPFFATPIPGISLKVWELFTNHGNQDVVKYPFGLTFYHAGFESIFLPNQGPVRAWWDSLLPIKHYDFEGYAYVGTTGLLILILLLTKSLHRISIKDYTLKPPKPDLPIALSVSIMAGVIALIPAIGIPFSWFPSLEILLGPLRQFRSPGRLAWVFYFTYFLFAAWYLFWLAGKLRQSQSQLASSLASLLLFAGIFLWGAEGRIMLNEQRNIIAGQGIDLYPEWQIEWESILSSFHMPPSEFQAILAVPFFHHGSEKIFLADWFSERYAQIISVKTGLPLVQNLAARASLSQTRKVIQLASHPLIDRDWDNSLIDKRPLLLVIHPGRTYSPGEQWLIDQSSLLGEVGEIRLAILPFEQIQADTTFLTALDSVTTKDSIQYPTLIRDGFGDDPTDPPGAMVRVCNPWSDLLWKGNIPTHPAEEFWEISVWIKISEETNYLPRLFVKQFLAGKEVFRERIVTMNTRDVWGEWAIARDTLLLPSGNIQLTAKAQGESFDRLMIRPINLNVLDRSQSSSPLLWNNYPLTPNP